MIRLHCLFYLLLFIGIQGWTAASAQNLVPNFSFEDTDCAGWYLQGTPYWVSPNNKTSDSYHSCKTEVAWQTPNANMGFQEPYDGQGYAGIRLFTDPIDPIFPDRYYREYLAVRLTQPLVAGVSYDISFKYSVGERAELTTDDLGIYISKTPIPSDLVLTYTPQIRNPEGQLLMNTTTWATLGGNYMAEGGEEYIVIGCFLPYEQITVYNFQPTIPRIYTAYVYIDDVAVEPCVNSIPPQVLGGDREVCDDFSSYQYNLNFPNTSYTWQDGTAGGVYTITAPGKYWIKTVQDGCAMIDTVTFMLSDVYALDLGNDTTLCAGSELSLSANVSGTFLWQDGSTDTQYTVTAPGNYSLEVHTPAGCSANDELIVDYEANPVISLAEDTVLCEGAIIELKAIANMEATFQWQDGTVGPIYLITEAGVYEVTAAHGSCTSSKRVSVAYEPCDPDPVTIIPNIITPNGDHLNDTFKIISDRAEQVWGLRIYNRWGRTVFTSDNYDNKWGDLDTPAGVYFYVVTDFSMNVSYQGILQVLH